MQAVLEIAAGLSPTVRHWHVQLHKAINAFILPTRQTVFATTLVATRKVQMSKWAPRQEPSGWRNIYLMSFPDQLQALGEGSASFNN